MKKKPVVDGGPGTVIHLPAPEPPLHPTQIECQDLEEAIRVLIAAFQRRTSLRVYKVFVLHNPGTERPVGVTVDARTA